MYLTSSGAGVLGTFLPNLSVVHSYVTQYKKSTDTAFTMALGQREQPLPTIGAPAHYCRGAAPHKILPNCIKRGRKAEAGPKGRGPVNVRRGTQAPPGGGSANMHKRAVPVRRQRVLARAVEPSTS